MRKKSAALWVFLASHVNRRSTGNKDTGAGEQDGIIKWQRSPTNVGLSDCVIEYTHLAKLSQLPRGSWNALRA